MGGPDLVWGGSRCTESAVEDKPRGASSGLLLRQTVDGAEAVHAEIESEAGNAVGTLILGDAGGWSGDLEQVDVGKLPLDQFEHMGTLDGLLDASVDILVGERGPEGSMTFEARDGKFELELDESSDYVRVNIDTDDAKRLTRIGPKASIATPIRRLEWGSLPVLDHLIRVGVG